MNLMKLWFWPNFNDNILNHSVVITNFQNPETRDIWMYKKSDGWTEMEGGLTKGQRYGQKGRHIDGQNDGQTDRWTNRNTEW